MIRDRSDPWAASLPGERRSGGRKVPRRRVELAWGCGGVRANARMQYTATSYAEPLTRVFDDALRAERDGVWIHAGECS